VLDQYIGLTQTNRYSKGVSLSGHIGVLPGQVAQHNPVVSESDLLWTIYAAASQAGGGYGNIYHIFLPPGVDTCFDLRNLCYSPDYKPSFAFCAYHASVTFTGIGHVLYTIQPYANVPGCRITGGVNATSGGDDPIDSHASLILHELAETITDPDGNAWYDPNFNEVGDICLPVRNTTQLAANFYTLQFLYSNHAHACTNANL